MATMVDKKCASCKKPIQVRAADVARGWGKFCSKSCKAKKQTQSHGDNYSKYKHYQRQYGGVPNFDSRGEYVGFQCTGFSNEE